MELTKTPRDARRGALPAAARLAPRGASLPDAGVVLPAMEIAMSGGDSRVLALKPESTEGGRRVSVLKRQEGAPVNLG